MSSRTAMARIYAIHQAIKAGGYPNVPYLVEELECSESTVRRDLETMRDRLGAPLVFNRRKRGYCYDRAYALPAVLLTKEELEAVWVAHEWLRQTSGTPYEQAMRRAWDKLAFWFGLDSKLMDEWSVVAVEGSPLRGIPEVLESNYSILAEAAQTRHVVSIGYYSPASDQVTTREIEPLSLYLAHEACYCVAFCRLRDEYRSFAVDRIRNIEATSAQFRPHADFSLQGYMEGSLRIMRGKPVALKIRFSKEQARYLDELSQHPSQRLVSADEGGVVYSFELADNLESLRWVLSFGSTATVLEPACFAEKIQLELKSALCKYSAK